MEHDLEATLYVDGSKYGDESSYSAETQAVLLTAAYTGECVANLVIVGNASRANELPKTGVKLPDIFKQPAFMQDEETPLSVQACRLPALLTHDKVNVYSGLCTVLRYLIKAASTEQSISNNLLALLGHRLYCLKSCSEVSPRTKLCELHMPTIVNTDSRKQVRNGDVIPQPINMFENLLNEPVMIHNMDKRQRVLLKSLEGNFTSTLDENRRKRKKVTWTKDLPALEHAFAEGVDFTLTDLCVFPCVHCFIADNVDSLLNSELSKTIPKTLKWYRRVFSMTRLRAALSMCHVSLIELPNSVLEAATIVSAGSGQTEVLELSQSGNKQKSTRRRESDVTLRRDLPKLLTRLELEGIQPKFTEYNQEDISLSWAALPKDVHPVEGELGTLRALRKCQQIENLTQAVKALARPNDNIVDFCSGGGHVGIVLAYLLPMCSIILVENKEESLDRARARINRLKLKNITVYQCNLEYFRGTFQVGVALHACGVASDMVVQSCLARNASFVVSPCCYGKVQNCHWISYPQSNLYRGLPVSFDESLLLGRAADKTSWNFSDRHAVEGKKCMGLVDLDRAHAAMEQGFQVSLFTMQPPTCSPKNNMLVGVAPRHNER